MPTSKKKTGPRKPATPKKKSFPDELRMVMEPPIERFDRDGYRSPTGTYDRHGYKISLRDLRNRQGIKPAEGITLTLDTEVAVYKLVKVCKVKLDCSE